MESLGVSDSRWTVLLEITQPLRSVLKPIRSVYKAKTHPRPLRYEHSSFNTQPKSGCAFHSSISTAT
ncbi:hypothetical protein QQF64_014505 [Cirrhinus molitorella]|uniref:Uncharacterized protein n=1 Tax=Cirrhinus molitorella TaxID=172907 RepID=A0ABR3NSP2_9TELE